MVSLIAHRGNSNHSYPENSKEALLSSIKDPMIAGIELDVRMTKDHKIVIFHNFLIDDKKHKLRKVSSLTLSELKQYDIDSSKHVFHISELWEVLDQVSNNKKILIEIKEEANDNKDIADYLYQVIKQYPELNIYICGFNKKLLTYFKQQYPNYRVGLIIGMFMNLDDLSNSFDFVSITTGVMERWDFSKETFVWTINRIEDLKKVLKKTNQVGIITDKANLLDRYLKHQA